MIGLSVICTLLVAMPKPHLEYWAGIDTGKWTNHPQQKLLIKFDNGKALYVPDQDCFYAPDAVEQFEREYRRNLHVPNPLGYDKWRMAHQPDIMPTWVGEALARPL